MSDTPVVRKQVCFGAELLARAKAIGQDKKVRGLSPLLQRLIEEEWDRRFPPNSKERFLADRLLERAHDIVKPAASIGGSKSLKQKQRQRKSRGTTP